MPSSSPRGLRCCSGCGMYSKRLLIAICALAIVSCASLPWSDEPAGEEVNLAFTLEKNLLVIRSATIAGHPGRFVFGSAEPRTVVDATFAQSLGTARAGAFP